MIWGQGKKNKAGLNKSGVDDAKKGGFKKKKEARGKKNCRQYFPASMIKRVKEKGGSVLASNYNNRAIRRPCLVKHSDLLSTHTPVQQQQEEK